MPSLTGRSFPEVRGNAREMPERVPVGVPRNFDVAARSLEGAYLCDLDDLAAVSNANLKARLAEVDRARAALAEKAARAWGAANHQASPEA